MLRDKSQAVVLVGLIAATMALSAGSIILAGEVPVSMQSVVVIDVGLIGGPRIAPMPQRFTSSWSFWGCR